MIMKDCKMNDKVNSRIFKEDDSRIFKEDDSRIFKEDDSRIFKEDEYQDLILFLFKILFIKNI